MHETQYRDYKSGIAKERFEAEIAKVTITKNNIKVKETQAPNRNSYSKKEPEKQSPMPHMLLHTV
jgi:hypothetical protein